MIAPEELVWLNVNRLRITKYFLCERGNPQGFRKFIVKTIPNKYCAYFVFINYYIWEDTKGVFYILNYATEKQLWLEAEK